MWTDRVQVLDDVAAADWLAPRLDTSFGAVTSTVPGGFPAYARILHPAGRETQQVTWAQVAAVTGRQVHATAQWHALVGSTDRWSSDGGLWPYERPRWGSLHIDALTALVEVLGQHTSTAAECYFCLWDGWGQLHGSPAVARLTRTRFPRFRFARPRRSAEQSVPPALTASELRAPRVSLPARTYLLMRGPLSATADLTRYQGAAWWTQSPNLFWPADQSWCVATEVDFDSTLVGGSVALIDALTGCPTIEAWPVGPDDSLAPDVEPTRR